MTHCTRRLIQRIEKEKKNCMSGIGDMIIDPWDVDYSDIIMSAMASQISGISIVY